MEPYEMNPPYVKTFDLTETLGQERLQVQAVFTAKMEVSEEAGWEIKLELTSAMIGGESVLDLLLDNELAVLMGLGEEKFRAMLAE